MGVLLGAGGEGSSLTQKSEAANNSMKFRGLTSLTKIKF